MNPIDGSPIDLPRYGSPRQLRATAREFLDSTAWGRRRILIAADSWGDRAALEAEIIKVHREEHGVCNCDRGHIEPPPYHDPYQDKGGES